MATVLLYSVNNCSSTDKPCIWNKQTPTNHNTMDSIFLSNKFVALKRKPNNADREFLYSALSADNYTGMYWFLSPEPNIDVDCSVLTFDDIINFSETECKTPRDKMLFIVDNMKLTDDNIKEIFHLTVGQRKNYLWGQFRKGRITASNFGLVLAALKREQFPPSLFKTLKGEYYIEKVKSVEWGIVHEKNAKNLYEEIKEVKVLDAGLYFHQSGILGCSPDGITNDKIIEIKCPFSKIGTDLIKLISEGKWFVKFTDTVMNAELRESNGVKVYLFAGNELAFNMKNAQGFNYYHQVQGILHIMNKESCDFVIWSPNMSIIFNVKKYGSWGPNIDKLISFYKNVLIYYLL